MLSSHTVEKRSNNNAIVNALKLAHTQNDSSIHAAAHIRHIHIYCEGTTQLLRTYRQAWCSKSIDFSIFWSTYMHRKYRDQSSSSSFRWVITQRTWKLTSKWSAFIHIDQSSPSSLSLMIIQTSRKLTLKWSAFTILNCLCDHLII